MRRSVVKVHSASQVAVHGNAKYMRSRHVTLGNKLVKVRFSANIFKFALEVGLFKSGVGNLFGQGSHETYIFFYCISVRAI